LIPKLKKYYVIKGFFEGECAHAPIYFMLLREYLRDAVGEKCRSAAIKLPKVTPGHTSSYMLSRGCRSLLK
jgi:hypothetical protein